MLSFLKLVFGSDITEAEYRYADDTPYYIRDGYTPQLLSWGQTQCIMYKSLCTGSGKFNCAAETEPDRKSHSFRFQVPASISSVLGMFLP